MARGNEEHDGDDGTIIRVSRRYGITVVAGPAALAELSQLSERAAAKADEFQAAIATIKLPSAPLIPPDVQRHLQATAATINAQFSPLKQLAQAASAEFALRERGAWRRKTVPRYRGPVRRPVGRRQPRGRPSRATGQRRARAPARPSSRDPELAQSRSRGRA